MLPVLKPEHEEAERTPRPAGALRALAVEDGRRAFLRAASHELRTPLNSIIGFSEIISRELYGPMSEPRYRDQAKMIHESGLTLLKLINEILEIARLEAGAKDLDLRAEQPMAAAEEVMRSLAAEAGRRNVRLELAGSADAPPAMADSRALQTILHTLVQTALAHSPVEGAVNIRIAGDCDWVVFEITDSGPGVAREDLSKLLNPFENDGGPILRRTEGGGFGLAIVEMLCKAMGGRLTARSDPGEGLTAIVRLPAAPAAPRG